jgi:glycosyltransferase involved in cell wall biosynthesis
MKVVYAITRADAVGGATVHVRDLSRALIARGDEAVVLVGGHGPVTDELEAAGVPCRSLRHLRRDIHPWHDLLAVAEAAAAIRALRPDLVSAHTAKAGCIVRLACAGMSVPVVYTPHGWAITDRISKQQGAIYRMVERAAAPLSSAIVNVCRYERDLAQRYRVGAGRLHTVIHNGITGLSASPQARPAAEPPAIVMVARFEQPKDHATLLGALHGLRHREWSLTLIGGGPGEPDARRRAEQLGLAGRIRFAGASHNVAEALAGAQIFVLSTRSEAFPRSILEAMRAGLPVVASDVGGVAEAVDQGRTGLLVPPQSPDALASALERLLLEPSLRARMGEAGRAAFERNFTFARMMRETFSLYDDLTAVPAPSLAWRTKETSWEPR